MSVSNIYLHPNQENPARVRLQLRELGIQEYFGFKAYGGKAKAIKAARARRDELVKLTKLRKSLGFRQLFSDNGMIKGIRLHAQKTRGYLVCSLVHLELGKPEKLIRERTVTPDNIDEVFHAFLEELLSLKRLTLDPQDKRLIKKARMHYVQACHSLYEEHVLPQKRLNEESLLDTTPLPFTRDNWICGLRVTDGKTPGRVSFLLRLRFEDNSLKEFSRTLSKKNFNDKFDEMVALVLHHHNLDVDSAEQHLLTKVRQKYRRKFNQLAKAYG